MRCIILAVSLAIIYAAASPVDEVVPEENLFALDDDLAEAQQKVNEMTSAGKSDKECRKLVTETRKEIQTNVDTCQKTMDALPRGEECPSRGQDGVKIATEAKSKADKYYQHTITEVTKWSSQSVNFGSRTFSSLTEGKCESFYSSTAYTTAESNYNAAISARTKAKGGAEQAAKDLKIAIEAAAKAKKECECKIQKDHNEAFAKHSGAHAANVKAWNFACKVECVLDGKTTCTCSAAPQCKRPKVTAAVMEADCAAKKKDDGRLSPNGAPAVKCDGTSNVIYLYSGPDCTGTKWTITKDLNFCDRQGMNDNVDSVQGCGHVKILHHCDKNSGVIWKNDGSFAKCQNLSAKAKLQGPSYVKF